MLSQSQCPEYATCQIEVWLHLAAVDLNPKPYNAKPLNPKTLLGVQGKVPAKLLQATVSGQVLTEMG